MSPYTGWLVTITSRRQLISVTAIGLITPCPPMIPPPFSARPTSPAPAPLLQFSLRLLDTPLFDNEVVNSRFSDRPRVSERNQQAGQTDRLIDHRARSDAIRALIRRIPVD